jgi:hypothetical protein
MPDVSAIMMGPKTAGTLDRMIRAFQPRANAAGDDNWQPLQNNAVVCKVVSAVTDAFGKYNGKILTPPTVALKATGNLSSEDLGTLANDCLIFNGAEVDQLTHDLTNSTSTSKFFVGVVLGATQDGKLVVGINGFDFEDCGGE